MFFQVKTLVAALNKDAERKGSSLFTVQVGDKTVTTVVTTSFVRM